MPRGPIKRNLPAGRVPRNATRAEVASYLRLPISEFTRRVEAGDLPAPAFEWGRGNAVWDLNQLDHVLDKRSGIDQPRQFANDAASDGDSDAYLEALK
ncbi:MAG: hypothetical protein QOJ54_102 [Aliidongia sp.]|jgi:hypothetical protein|nr:hypothetical protein [Aliidongia sp.]